MSIPNEDAQITPSIDCIYCLKRLETKLNNSINQNSIKVPKNVEPSKKKTLL